MKVWEREREECDEDTRKKELTFQLNAKKGGRRKMELLKKRWEDVEKSEAE